MIQGSKRHRIPDHGSGSATLNLGIQRWFSTRGKKNYTVGISLRFLKSLTIRAILIPIAGVEESEDEQCDKKQDEDGDDSDDGGRGEEGAEVGKAAGPGQHQRLRQAGHRHGRLVLHARAPVLDEVIQLLKENDPGFYTGFPLLKNTEIRIWMSCKKNVL